MLAFSLLFLACSTTQEVREPFTVDLKSPQIPAGTIEVQSDKLLAKDGLKRDYITVSYFPIEDAVCLQYRMDFVTYYQFWSREGRSAFIKALENYKEDYAQRAFGRSSRKSKKHYDTIEGYLVWQMFTFSIQAKAEVKINLGYFFKDRRPFFSVNQCEAFYFDPVSRSDSRQANAITMYYTRAQADGLAALFDQEFLRGLSAANVNNANPGFSASRELILDDY